MEIRGIWALSTLQWYVEVTSSQRWRLTVKVPIQTRLVLPEMLTPEQRKWLNDYHAEVQDKVMPVLRDFGDDRAAAWLEKECRSI